MAREVLVSDCFAGVPRSHLVGIAARHGCAAVVSDDGMQSPDLRPDALLVVLRAEDPWGNGKRLPAGPLREGPECLARADLVVWHGLDHGPAALPPEADERWVGAHYEVLMPPLAPHERVGMATAIADPERLLRSLARHGVEPEQKCIRRDHGALPLTSLDPSLVWLTTSKDLARHRGRVPEGLDLRCVEVRLCWSDEGQQVEALIERLMRPEVDTGEAGQ
jgi:tetraacyldisaccharide 4'-kinase